MAQKNNELEKIWQQKEIGIVYRQKSPEPVLVKIPNMGRFYSDEGYLWLRGERRSKPKWSFQYKCWGVPQAWFDIIVKQFLEHYKQVYIIQIHREQQKCAPVCWNAKGFHCECSCMGAHHGEGHPDGSWYEVSDTFATYWGPKKYACRLLRTKDFEPKNSDPQNPNRQIIPGFKVDRERSRR